VVNKMFSTDRSYFNLTDPRARFTSQGRSVVSISAVQRESISVAGVFDRCWYTISSCFICRSLSCRHIKRL